MVGRSSESQRRRVVKLIKSAHRARIRGNLNKAIADYRAAVGLIRELAQAEPDVSEHQQQLGSTLYDLAQVLIDIEAAQDAIAALDEAEGAYDAVDDAEPLIADVRLRRATAHMSLDHRASALVDTQLAVLVYLTLFTGDDDPLGADVARALARHSVIVLSVGDPDVAVAAADWAIRLYTAHADEINADRKKRVVHNQTFRMAVEVAVAIHGAYGRRDLAEQAAGLLTRTAGRFDLPDQETISKKLTLAEALDRLRLTELRTELTRPAADCEILTVADRASPPQAHFPAVKLADVVDATADHHPDTAMRIALEAHGMFVFSSESGTMGLRHQLGEFGPSWAHMMMRCSKSAAQSGRHACAIDMASWMGGVVEQLMQHALTDTEIRSVLLNCMDWHAELLATNGDTTGAENIRSTATRLGNLG